MLRKVTVDAALHTVNRRKNTYQYRDTQCNDGHSKASTQLVAGYRNGMPGKKYLLIA